MKKLIFGIFFLSGLAYADPVSYIQLRKTVQPSSPTGVPSTLFVTSGTINTFTATTAKISSITSSVAISSAVTVSSLTVTNLTSLSTVTVSQSINFTGSGTSSSPSIRLTGGCGAYDSGTSSFRLECAGNEKFSVDANNVNIATNSTVATGSVMNFNGTSIASVTANARIQGAGVGDTGLTPTTAGITSTDLLNRLNQIAGQIQSGYGLTNWYDTPTVNMSSFTITAGTATAATSFVNTTLKVTITPRKSTSRVRITACGTMANSTAANTFYTITRNSTNLGDSSNGFGRTSIAGVFPWCIADLMDAPATTSATVYTVQIKVDGGTGTLATTGNAYITATEVP